MRKLLLGVTAALGMALFSSQASAVTINFAGNGGLANSYSFSSGGVGVDVTATTFNNSGPTGDFAYVGQYSRGLGVTSHYGDSHQVDGRNRNDLLIFDFDQQVTLKSVKFSYVDRYDDFRFFFQDLGSGDLVDFGTQVDIPGTGFATYVFASLWTGTKFGIGAYGKYDNFKVKKPSCCAGTASSSSLAAADRLERHGLSRLAQKAGRDRLSGLRIGIREAAHSGRFSFAPGSV